MVVTTTAAYGRKIAVNLHRSGEAAESLDGLLAGQNAGVRVAKKNAIVAGGRWPVLLVEWCSANEWLRQREHVPACVVAGYNKVR